MLRSKTRIVPKKGEVLRAVPYKQAMDMDTGTQQEPPLLDVRLPQYETAADPNYDVVHESFKNGHP
jgi:hypothetical protein